jgi:alpha-amylase
MTSLGSEPLRFCFGLHLHQPVGNFGYVFEGHVREVYRPFVARAVAHRFFPVALHISGPLLEWLQQHDRALLDMLGEHAAAGDIELLLAGFYEPILAAIPRADRVEQIAWMREALRKLFGVEARGLWLTERVWEPDLAADLHAAGVEFVLVDDWHFLAAGFQREQLHLPFRTEHDGKSVALFPIDERLRYLVPFQPVERVGAYLAELRGRGVGLAVLADDGEKFGGWPGTADWVYGSGWLDRFMREVRSATERGELRLSRFDEALGALPSGGLAYLGTTSYREMEHWSLPLEGALRLAELQEELGEERLRGRDGAFLRGSHWRNFLVKYPEANRMHKKMLALSRLCRERGDPAGARRSIARAQCNDAYWHGVFGGLYLPFLRAAVWSNLLSAERDLRAGEPLRYEALDLDCDGYEELWIHSSECSVVVSPARGGSIEELSFLTAGFNLADVLTRRREAYHILAARGRPSDSERTDGTPSIHELEQRLTLSQLPPADDYVRAIFQERVLRADTSLQDCVAAACRPLWDGTSAVYAARVISTSASVTVSLVPLVPGAPLLEKQLTVASDGGVTATFTWDPARLPEGAWFSTELSCTQQPELACDADAQCWRYDVETASKSERGLERTRQGVALLVRWPGKVGSGRVTIAAPVVQRSPSSAGGP